MGIADRVPGMRAGSTLWNLLVFSFYVVFSIPLLSLIILLLPPILAYFVGVNRGNWADRLSIVPGISAEGGLKSAVVVFLVASVVPLAVIGSSGPTQTAPPPSETPTAAATTSQPTAVPTTRTTAVPTATATPAPTATATAAADQTGTQVTVVEIVDGDTVDIRYQNGTRATARLLGVDTPEVHSETSPDEFEGVPDSSAGRQCLREYGDRASSFARDSLLGETVTISFDENEGRTGYYGRLLVYIHTKQGLFNYQLVEQGYARVYDSQFEKRDRFYDAEEAAQSAARNVWSCRNVETATPTPTPVPDGGSTGGELRVAEIHADAEGNDHENLNDEYITFENSGDSSIQLGGYTVRDTADHVYRVPSGTTLEAGDQITLYTGSGEDTETALYWGSNSAIWNNGGDTIIVKDDSGNTVLEREYDG